MNPKTTILAAAIVAATAVEAVGLFLDRCARVGHSEAVPVNVRPCFSQGNGGMYDLSVEVPFDRGLGSWAEV